MSGRRLRDSVKKVLIDSGFPSNATVVIAGLSNTYSDYVTTFEEYQVIVTSELATIIPHLCDTVFRFSVMRVLQQTTDHTHWMPTSKNLGKWQFR